MKHVELSSKSGSLANVLTVNRQMINEYTADASSINEFKAYLSALIISNAADKKLSKATNRFLVALQRARTKTEISSLVFNTILAGDNLSVI